MCGKVTVEYFGYYFLIRSDANGVLAPLVLRQAQPSRWLPDAGYVRFGELHHRRHADSHHC